jgi:hypothetical protein
MFLQRKIDKQRLEGVDKVRWYDATDSADFAIPTLGAHDISPPFNRTVWRPEQIRRGGG